MTRARKPRGKSAPSLGPSNDDSPAVQIEMRAAELEAWIAIDGLHVDGEFSAMEADGWKMWVVNGDLVGKLADEVRHLVEPGWLAAESYNAGYYGERDEAWAWDISRPLAEQLAETAADDAAADALVDEINRPVEAPAVPPGNEDSAGTTCTCGHSVEEHGNDPEFPGSTACDECDGECIAYESDGAA